MIRGYSQPDWQRLHILWHKHMSNVNGNDKVSTFEFPIGDIPGQALMKNIPLSTLPNFHGLESEDPNTFLFEFNVLC
jgi:hypothetical protein